MYAAVSRLVPRLRSLGPYVLMELLLPGGTLLALLLWISQGLARGGLVSVQLPVAAPSAVECVVMPATSVSTVAGARA